jgi:hypothetical protein
MRTARFVASFLVAGWVGVVSWNSGCGGSSGGGPGSGDDSGVGGSGSGSGASSGIIIQEGGNTNTPAITTKDGKISVDACTGKGATSISGKVFDPAGKNPVYNAAVWVPYTNPGTMPRSLTMGLTCNCSELYTGGFVGAYALTDPTGYFKIDGAPASLTGGNVPLVIQVGKWRTVTSVAVACGQDNHSKDGDLRLPQGRPGSGVAFPGDLPDLAISTGGADTLECLLTRIGVAQSEYTSGVGSGGHVHIYQGAPSTSPAPVGAPQSSASLWDTPAHLEQYDAVLLSCEGAPTMNANPSALFAYGTSGGRVFASHYHYQWFLGQPFPNLGTWYTTHQNQLVGLTSGIIQTKLPNGQTFQEGVAMQAWLQNVNALDSSGELQIAQARHNVDVGFPNFPQAVPWMYFDPAKSTFDPNNGTYDPVSAQSTLYFSYDTRGAQGEASCGRIVYSDLHVGGNSGDYGESPNASSPPAGRTDVPSGCNANVDLSAQEKALEFMLFDLTSCLAPPGSPDAGVTIMMAK